jgi:hypothetical protein
VNGSPDRRRPKNCAKIAGDYPQRISGWRHVVTYHISVEPLVGTYYPFLGQLGVAVFFHEAGDGVAAEPAAGFALDRERWDAEVGESVRVVSQW